MTVNNLDLIYEQWKAALQQKDRSRKYVSGNFDELFDQLHSAGATFEEAHTYLQPATKMHLPNPALARATWKRVKNEPSNAELSEKDFIDGWNKDITDKATNSFFSIFPRPLSPKEEAKSKMIQGMTREEYNLQQKIASRFKVLDTEELEKRLQTGDFLSLEEIKGILGKNNDGKSN